MNNTYFNGATKGPFSFVVKALMQGRALNGDLPETDSERAVLLAAQILDILCLLAVFAAVVTIIIS